METMSTLKRDKTFTQPIIWVTTIFMAAFHILAIAAQVDHNLQGGRVGIGALRPSVGSHFLAVEIHHNPAHAAALVCQLDRELGIGLGQLGNFHLGIEFGVGKAADFAQRFQRLDHFRPSRYHTDTNECASLKATPVLVAPEGREL